MVTDIDQWVEENLVREILKARPHDGILGEEGASRQSSSGITWIIDPIDGTTNFIYDIPGYSISVAADIDGHAVAGLVHDPVRDERFRATLGGGASRNNKPIFVSGPPICPQRWWQPGSPTTAIDAALRPNHS